MISEAVAFVLAAVEPGTSQQRMSAFAALIGLRTQHKRWGAAELALAALELPFDAVVGDKVRFNRPVLPADFERVIAGHRRLRRTLRDPMSASERRRLIEHGGSEIDASGFRVCGHDEKNQPLYRYVPP